MRNFLLIILAIQVLSIKGSDSNFSLTIEQINNRIVQPRQDSNCKGSFCFVGDTLFTVQSDGKRITSITLSNSNPQSYNKLVIETCPTQNLLTLNDEDMLRLYAKTKSECYPFTNFMGVNKYQGLYSFVINALLADQQTYQYFDLDINLKNSQDKSDTSSSSNSYIQKMSILMIALYMLI
ncbi:hypothetical protein TTHERM_01031270 (macronuclear) [Tetrahymena thermophila SB210]|uniref:Transmembrane protein n=1 Tax=Tetrahymena thermophila (strain SB210) TaxID=312017 RepID=Q235K3_TETTS|nr:hypothetical protein TTHERM_01031270 [Tetrahymena thermophila SB210]EAR92198.1 hypothetical protein TTHERM_01031270 [Tetrahymena thermophila SB210]|eukprot:XP_001012443.1 hypothetical protein TTHERM_01031270 [Tetrahymena thermophila SB210]